MLRPDKREDATTNAPIPAFRPGDADSDDNESEASDASASTAGDASSPFTSKEPSTPAQPFTARIEQETGPKVGQLPCPKCGAGVDEGRYFCRVGHRVRTEDRSKPAPEPEHAVNRPKIPLKQRLRRYVGPTMSMRSRVLRLGMMSGAGVLLMAMLPPWGAKVRSQVGDGIDTSILQRKGAAIEIASAGSSTEISGLLPANAVDGFDQSAWGTTWDPALSGIDETTVECGTSSAGGAAPLEIALSEPAEVDEVEVGLGIDEDIDGAEQHAVPRIVDITFDNGSCIRVVAGEGDTTKTAGVGGEPKRSASVLIVDAFPASGGPGTITSLREITFRE